MKTQMTALAILLSSVVTANAADTNNTFNFLGFKIPYHVERCHPITKDVLNDPHCNFFGADSIDLKSAPVVDDGDDNGGGSDGGNGDGSDDNGGVTDDNGGPTSDDHGPSDDTNGDDSSDNSNGDNSEDDRGHGNDDDRDDDDNPGKGKGHNK